MTEKKKAELEATLTRFVELSKEAAAEITVGDPYAAVDIPDPIGEVIDVSEHPAILQFDTSMDAAEAEVGLFNTALNFVKKYAGRLGLSIGGLT